MPQLHEQYRPGDWNDVVGQEKAIRQIQTISNRGLGGRAFWISGKSGTGKTTIAKLIAAEIADDWTTNEVDSSDLTPKAVKDFERMMSCRAIGEKGGHALLVNEAHGLRKDTIRQLLVTLERLSAWSAWIFTTTNEGQQSLFDEHIDAHPLLSRCVIIGLKSQGLNKAFARRCQKIAVAEGLCDEDVELGAFERLAEDCKSNMRMMLQRIEAGEMIAEENLSLKEMFS